MIDKSKIGYRILDTSGRWVIIANICESENIIDGIYTSGTHNLYNLNGKFLKTISNPNSAFIDPTFDLQLAHIYCKRFVESVFDSLQQDHICYVIGEWYLKWKEKDISSHFGLAKEELKKMICDTVPGDFHKSWDEYQRKGILEND